MQLHGINSIVAPASRMPALPARSLRQLHFPAVGARRHVPLTVASAAKGKAAPVTEADLYTSIDPSSAAPPPSSSGTPWYITFPAGFVALFAVLRTIGALSRRRNRALEERGYKRSGSASDDNYEKAIRGMKVVQFEELSDEQVEAARRRRRQEIQRDGGTIDLDKIELPENHPFAVKKEISAEEEEMQRLRLSARRGLSAEDMKLLKQQQELAEQMEREAEEREKARQEQQQQQQ